MSGASYHPRPIRAIEAAQRRLEREAKKRLRDLERQAKERAKLSELEQARLEVEKYENRLELLLSIHREQGESWNWYLIAATLPPVPPKRCAFHELKARQSLALAFEPDAKRHWEGQVEIARARDESEFQQSLSSYTSRKAEWQELNVLSRLILDNNYKAYADALILVEPLGEISDLGSSFRFTPHSVKLLECNIKVNGTTAIPNETKTLTASGKLSIKATPKAMFHEIYQDYVCGCMLRVAREVLALLPVETLLVTATTDLLDTSTGQVNEQAVLSAVIHRAALAELDFDRLDPSDAIESFHHRGDFKATRKSGAFLPITPLTPIEVASKPIGAMKVDELLVTIGRLRKELKEDSEELGPTITSVSP